MRFVRVMVPEVRSLLASNPEQLSEALSELHPVDVADLLLELQPKEAAEVLRLLPGEEQTGVFESLDEDQQAPIVTVLPREEAARLIGDLSADDRVDLVQELTPQARDDILPLLGKEEAREVRELAAYPPRSAGGRMTTEFVSLRAEMRVEDAIEHVRDVAAEKETIVLWGSVVGAALPILLRRLRQDPAFASGPFVATFVDVSGILIYLGVAMLVIPKLQGM